MHTALGVGSRPAATRVRTLGQQIVRQHIPLAATAVQVEQRIQDFPHVDLPRAPSSWVLLGGWDQWFHNRPWLIRQIRWILLPYLTSLYHMRALLCCWDMRSLSAE